MRVLLDTSAYSLMKRRHPGAAAAVRSAELIGVTAVVLGELLGGFVAGRREARNRQELTEFLDSGRVHLLPMGVDTAERFALVYRTLRDSGRPIPTNDIWIAASALEYGLRLVTADAHYALIPMLLTDVLAI